MAFQGNITLKVLLEFSAESGPFEMVIKIQIVCKHFDFEFAFIECWLKKTKN